MRTRTLEQLAKHVGGTVHGDPNTAISGVATMEAAGPGSITFYGNTKYEFQLKTTKASAVIVSEKLESNAALLIVDDPYYALMQIVVLIYGHRKHKQTGISKKASISESAKIGKNCNIADFSTVSDNAKIGDNCTIYPGVFIGPDVTLGDDCIIYPNAVIYNNCIIGSRVIIHSSASIGQDGYGFATHQGVHHKIPQTGIVIIEDDVEIGAAACIERATLGETVVAKGTKIGDMVAVGHGTKVGEHCLLVPQVGIAGSSTLGHHVALGGQVGIAGHITIGNMVQIGAKSGLSKDVPDGQALLGVPAMDANKTKRIYGTLPQLPDMRRRIKQLEKKLAKLEDNEG